AGTVINIGLVVASVGENRLKAESPLSVTESSTRSSSPLLVMEMVDWRDVPTKAASNASGLLGVIGTRICGFCGYSSGHPAPRPTASTTAAKDHLRRAFMSVIFIVLAACVIW